MKCSRSPKPWASKPSGYHAAIEASRKHQRPESRPRSPKNRSPLLWRLSTARQRLAILSPPPATKKPPLPAGGGEAAMSHSPMHYEASIKLNHQRGRQCARWRDAMPVEGWVSTAHQDTPAAPAETPNHTRRGPADGLSGARGGSDSTETVTTAQPNQARPADDLELRTAERYGDAPTLWARARCSPQDNAPGADCKHI